MKLLATTLIASTLSLSASAFAAAGVSGACQADIQKLCPTVRPGGGRIAACLKEHKKDVSDECKSDLRNLKEKRSAGANLSSDTSAN